MSLIPWSRRTALQRPFASQFQDDIADLFRGFPAWPSPADEGWMPSINVKDNDKHITVTAELPGVKKEDIKLEVDGSMLTVRGEKREEKTEKSDKWWRREASYGSFMRRVTLPSEVDPGHAEAKMDNGVLEVRLPKLATAKTKNIKVG